MIVWINKMKIALGKANKKLVGLIISIILCVFLFSIIIHADTGPKPEINITGINMPDELCYMDLLVDYPRTFDYTNLDDLDSYNSEMLGLLQNYNIDGWRPGLVTGTGAPMFGDIVCTVENGATKMRFSYMGVPDRYRIIVVTESGNVVVSNIIEKKAFQSYVYFDFLTEEAYEEIETPLSFRPFLISFLVTIIIEGILLILFGFSMKKNYKPFLIINLLTQISLNAIIGLFMVMNGTSAAFLAYIVFEIVILIVETVYFGRYLVEHSVLRRRVYGVVANCVSFLFGIVVLFLEVFF